MNTATFHKGYLLLSWEYRCFKLFLLHKYLTQALWNNVRPLAESYELMHAHARTMMTLSQVSLKLPHGRESATHKENSTLC
jgi:hypothetical protein